MYNNSNEGRPRIGSSSSDQRQGSAQNRGYGNPGYSPNRNGYQGSAQNRGYGNTQGQDAAKDFFLNHSFNSSWVTNGADEKLVEYAEKAGEFMAKNGLTNSKIRSIYGEIKRIQMGVFDKEKSSFYLLKPKVAYALGRDQYNNGLKLFKLIFDEASKYVSEQKSYQNFCNLIESVLAYHKAFGGKD